jgi:membrane protease YdiL (CAAX protease family)
MCVRGRLSQTGAAWFEGFTLTVDETTSPPLTCLEGPVMDQAELHGVISRVRDLGLTLITVQRMDERRVKMETGSETVTKNFQEKGECTMKTKTLIPFLALTFGLTWGIAALLIFFTDQVVAIFGELSSSNPLYILAVYSPGIVGIFLVWRNYGLKGLGSFFRRLTLWRMPKVWWLFLLLGIPAIKYLGAALNGTISTFPFSPWYLVFPALAQYFFLGTLEEFGWRGLAQPLLQRKMAPFWAGLIVGIIWAVWHTPAFLMSGTVYDNWSLVPLFGGIIALSVILTPLFNSARGSLLIAYLYHFQVMNPIIPDGQPWENLLFALAAVIIVVLNRHTMFKRGAGVTEVLMPEQSNNLALERDEMSLNHPSTIG